MCSSSLRSCFCAFLALCLGSTVLQARELRVCADPDNLPFSHRDGSGLENKIAAVIASELDATLKYTWMPQWRGFLRKTLKAGKCDVVLGYPPDYRILRSTRPYYRSSYVFVTRAGAPIIRSFADPKLRNLKIGVQLVGDDGSNTPPVHALSRRGIVKNVHGYPVYGAPGADDRLSPIVDAVARGAVDVAIVWGPIAGFFAQRQNVPLTLTPVLFDPSALYLPMTYDIAIGVRRDDTRLASELDQAIGKHQPRINAILSSYGVPRMDGVTHIGEVQ